MPHIPISGSSTSTTGTSHNHDNKSLLDGLKLDAYGRVYFDASGGSDPDISANTSLCLMGNLTDISGQGNHPTPSSGNSPSLVLGLDNKASLYFNGSTNQELAITPFLGSALGVTLYAVFCPEKSDYTLVDTYTTGDSWWSYSNQGTGYLCAFLNQRLDSYPSNMPQTGWHLISIHARSSDYEVYLDNQSKGLVSISSRFYVGNSFKISLASRMFKGYLSLLCVVPQWLSVNSSEHQRKLSGIKARFPGLPFSV